MRWRLLIIATFVLAGAVLNVAVAWVITAATTWPGWPSSPTTAPNVGWPRSVPDHWPNFATTIQGPVFGWRMDQYLGYVVEDRNGEPWATEQFALNITSVGWPRYALQSETWYDYLLPHAEGAVGHYRFDGQQRLATWFHGISLSSPRFGFGLRSWKTLPVRPIWPGFAVNTFFYAAILWLPICGPFALRRFIRLKRGLCEKCAYPVGKSSVCTECGRELAT